MKKVGKKLINPSKLLSHSLQSELANLLNQSQWRCRYHLRRKKLLLLGQMMIRMMISKRSQLLLLQSLFQLSKKDHLQEKEHFLETQMMTRMMASNQSQSHFLLCRSLFQSLENQSLNQREKQSLLGVIVTLMMSQRKFKLNQLLRDYQSSQVQVPRNLFHSLPKNFQKRFLSQHHQLILLHHNLKKR